MEHRSRRILHTSLPLEAPHLPGYEDLFSQICNSGVTGTCRTEVRTSFLLGYLTLNNKVCVTIKCELSNAKGRQTGGYAHEFHLRPSSSSSFCFVLFVYANVNKCMLPLLLTCFLWTIVSLLLQIHRTSCNTHTFSPLFYPFSSLTSPLTLASPSLLHLSFDLYCQY